MTPTRWPLVALAVFVTAFVLRLVYLGTIVDIGFFEQPVSDGRIYDQRAQEIAAGDLLGSADFVHAPLYAYVLGGMQAVVGHDLWTVRVIQMLQGSASCVLLLLGCRRFFGDGRVAIVAAALLAAYPPALFFDGLIQKTGLALFLSTLLLWLLAPLRDNNLPANSSALRRRVRLGWLRWLAAGLVMGLLVLTRQNALALVPLVAAWLWLGTGRICLRARPVLTCACVAGLALPLAPWALRNKVVTGALVLTTPNLGQNFAMGNHPQGSGTYLPFKRGRSNAEYEQVEWVKAAEADTGAEMSAREVSDYYLRAALQYVRANPGDWLRLMGKKCLMVWNSYEAFDTEDYYLYQEWSGPLRVLDRFWHFGVLCPLAAAGIVLTWSRRRELWLLYGWLLITAAAVAVFVVFARYRLPLVPVLAMFGAAAIVEGAALVGQGRLRLLVAAGTVSACAALICNWPIHHHRRPDPVSYLNHGAALAAQGRFEEDLSEISKALTMDGDNVDAHLAAGSTLVQLERYEAGLRHYQAARDGDPGHAGAYRGLGDALTGLGRWAEAEQHYRQALQIEPDHVQAGNGLASALARQGRFNEAVERFARVLELDPTYADAYLNLGNTFASAGRLDDAAAAYQQALQHRPACADAWHNLGLLELKRGRPEAAVDVLRRAAALEPHRSNINLALAAALIQARQPTEAARLMSRLLEPDSARANAPLLRVADELAWTLATSADDDLRDGAAAVELAKRLCQLTGDRDPRHLRAYAAALAEAGQFNRAVDRAREAIAAASSMGLRRFVDDLREQLAAYEVRRPWRAAADAGAG